MFRTILASLTLALPALNVAVDATLPDRDVGGAKDPIWGATRGVQ
jgi:hypothetical protein